MSNRLIKQLTIYISLIIIQILICNQFMLFGVAIIFVYVYSILTFKIDTCLSAVLTMAFFGGLIIDIFSDTLGVNTMACLILAVVRKPLFFAYVPKDDRSKCIVPTSNNIGFANYAKYVLTCVTIFCIVLYSVEYLNYINILDILLYSICSTVATFLVLLGLDSLLEGKRNIY